MDVDPARFTPPEDENDIDAWLAAIEDDVAAEMRATVRRLVGEALEEWGRSLTAAGDPTPFDTLPARWGTAVVDDFGDVFGGLYQAGALNVFVRAPGPMPSRIGARWADVVNEDAVDYQRTATNRIVGSSTRMWNRVRERTVLAVSDGWSNERLKDEIEATTRYCEQRADAIARTETMGAYNGGSYDGAVALGSAGPAEKVWYAALDARTRLSHSGAHAQVVPLQGSFVVGGVSMDRPHDPGAPAREVVHCRCRMQFLYPGDKRPDGSTTGEDALTEGPVIPDEEIGGWIADELRGDPDQSAAALLRKWKASGRPANDRRFRDIYRNVKEGGSGVRGPKPITRPLARPLPTTVAEPTNIADARAALRAELDEINRVEDADWLWDYDNGTPRYMYNWASPDVNGVQRYGYAVGPEAVRVNEAVTRLGRLIDAEIRKISGIGYDDIQQMQAALNSIDRRRDFLAWDRVETSLRAYRSAYRRAALDVLDETRGVGGAAMRVSGPGSEVVRQACRYYPDDWIRAIDVDYTVENGVTRGYHQRWQKHIALSDDGYLGPNYLEEFKQARIATHEIGHAVEVYNRDVLRLEGLYYWERAGTGTASRWAKGGPPRTWVAGETEWGFEDDWAERYAGRDYGSTAYEVLTIGMESMFGGSPARWWKTIDEDHAHWLLGMLGGV